MSQTPAIAIFAQSAAKASYLSEIVRLAGYVPAIKDLDKGPVLASLVADKMIPVSAPRPILHLRPDGEGAAAEKKTDGIYDVRAPLRAGDAVALIRSVLRAHAAPPAKIAFGDGTLDTRENIWARKGAASIRLTEKETAILILLRQASGTPVSRETLLEKVWSYAEGVQTHTIETHIYRLRQKIEADPNAPEILLTTDDGYLLGV